MTTMPAVVKTARGDGNVALGEWPAPRPGPGQVLLAVRAAGIRGTDLHIYHDEFPTQPPVVLGHELAGEVAAVGDGVTRIAPGDRVTVETYFSSGLHEGAARHQQQRLCSLHLAHGATPSGRRQGADRAVDLRCVTTGGVEGCLCSVRESRRDETAARSLECE